MLSNSNLRRRPSRPDHAGRRRRRRDEHARRGTGRSADGRLELIAPGVARLPGSAEPRRSRRSPAAVLRVAGLARVASFGGPPLGHHHDRADDPVDVIVPTRTRSLDLRWRDRASATGSEGPQARAQGQHPRRRTCCGCSATSAPSTRAAVPAAVGHVVTARLASPVALRKAIDRHSRRGRHGVPAFRAALEEWVIDGRPVDSVLEPAMRRLFATLPASALRVPRPHRRDTSSTSGSSARRSSSSATDGSSTPRRGPSSDADAARDAHLAEHGYISVRFTYHQIVRRSRPSRRDGSSGSSAVGRRTSIWAPQDLGIRDPPRPEGDLRLLRAQMDGARRVTSGACGCRRRRGSSRR